MNDPVEPAMTKAEWEVGIIPDSTEAFDKGVTDVGGGTLAVFGHFRDKRRHALAALCLHGQPYGFTREDVGLLRRLRDAAEWAAEYAESADAGVEGSDLADLAGRIQALLPPREETP